MLFCIHKPTKVIFLTDFYFISFLYSAVKMKMGFIKVYPT